MELPPQLSPLGPLQPLVCVGASGEENRDPGGRSCVSKGHTRSSCAHTQVLPMLHGTTLMRETGLTLGLFGAPPPAPPGLHLCTEWPREADGYKQPGPQSAFP